MKIIIPILSIFFLLSCNSNKKVGDSSSDRDLIEKNVRHGWTVFTGPKRTIIGVNDEDSIGRGHALFTKHCQSCHGVNGSGDGPRAKELGITPANLTAIAGVLPNHYLVMQINDGRGNMPQWKDILSPQDSWDLTNYIQTFKKQSK